MMFASNRVRGRPSKGCCLNPGSALRLSGSVLVLGHEDFKGMPYRADIELARVHLDQLEQAIEHQRVRIAMLRESGQPSATSDDLLTVLCATRDQVKAYIERTLERAKSRESLE